MDSGLTVRIRPCHLSVRLNLYTSVHQLKAEMQQASRHLRFGSQHFHSRLAENQQNAVYWTTVGQLNLHRCLHGHAVRPPTFPAQQRSHGPQPTFSFLFGERLLYNEGRAATKNIPYRRAIRSQSHRYWRIPKIQLAGFFQNFRCGLRILEINNEQIESLLMTTVDCRREIAETFNHNPVARENPAQNLGC